MTDLYYKATRADGISFYDPSFQYHIGQNIHPKPDRKSAEPCGVGIHLAKSIDAVKHLKPNLEELYEAFPGVILGEDDEKVRCASCVIVRKLEPKEYKSLPLDLPPNSLCGSEWLKEHAHDLDNWHPTIEIIRPGSKQTFTIKDPEIMNEVVKLLRSQKARRSK